MTSIAVTASVCANASEAALLVASFMHFSLDPGTRHPRPRRPDDLLDFYSEHPMTSIRFDESPLSEYRRTKSRIVMRRQFDSRVTTLVNVGPVNSGQDLRLRDGAAEFCEAVRVVDPASSAG